MKKIFVLVLISLLAIDVCAAQAPEKARSDEQTQEERDLELLSKRLVRMKKEMDKFVKDMTVAYQDPAIAGAGAFGGDVKVDITENDKNYIVTADLPGMDKDKIEVTLTGGRMLKIAGTRRVELHESSPGVVRQERMEGRFERVLELPGECKSEGIGASYENGVLEIVIPKNAPQKSEAVKVKVQ